MFLLCFLDETLDEYSSYEGAPLDFEDFEDFLET
jgi:hypothetical protein